MRLKEQRLWDRMRNNIGAGHGIRLERIENMVGSGFPDVWAICNGVVRPIELKAVERAPARITTRLIPSGEGLNVDQRNWHLDWRKHGGRSFIVLGLGSGAAAWHYVVSGSHGDQVNDWPQFNWCHNSLAQGRGNEFWKTFIVWLGSIYYET